MEEVKKVFQYCIDTGYCSFDFETNAKPVMHPEFFPTMLGVSFQMGSGYYIPLKHKDAPKKIKGKWKEILKLFYEMVLKNTGVTKICWNIQFEDCVLMRYGYQMRGTCLCAMLAKYHLDEEKPHGLKPNVVRFLDEEFHGYEGEKKGKNFDWANADLTDLGKYCAADCDLTLRLMLFFEKKLIDLGMYKLYRNLSMQIARVLAESKMRGLPIDVEYLDKMEKHYAKLLDDLHKKLFKIKKIKKFNKTKKKKALQSLIDEVNAEIESIQSTEEESPARARKIKSREEKVNRYIKKEFTTKKENEKMADLNFNSVPQMIDLLYGEDGYNFKVVDLTKTGNPSTSEDTLVKLQDKDKSGFIESLLKLRGIQTLYSTFIKGMQEGLINGKIHGSWLVHGTVTGRLSSKGPNMQNIPRVTTNPDIKKMFISPKGKLLVQLDYSQAELRVLAEDSGDEAMIDIFNRGYNIHMATGLKIIGELDKYEEANEARKDKSHPKNEFWTKVHKKGKTINFAIVYGQSKFQTAATLGITVKEAEKLQRGWFEEFPQAAEHIKNLQEHAREEGYVMNPFGRKRRLGDIWSENEYKRAEAERQSVNAPIQGAASDFTQFSTVILREEVQKGNLPSYIGQVNTVHDAIFFFMNPEHLDKYIPMMVDICANPETKKWFGFQYKSVRMKVSVEVGYSWASQEDWIPGKDYSYMLEENNDNPVFKTDF